MRTCKTCELIANRNAGAAPPWDCIYRTSLWDVVHSYDTALPGWIVLVVRRHIESLAELTDPEACAFPHHSAYGRSAGESSQHADLRVLGRS